MLWYRGRRASARHSGCAPFRLRSDAGRRSSRRLALRRCERRASSDQGHSHARVHSMPLPGNVLDRASHLPGGRFDSRERRRALAAECVSRAHVRRACLDRLHLRAHALWEDWRRPAFGRTGGGQRWTELEILFIRTRFSNLYTDTIYFDAVAQLPTRVVENRQCSSSSSLAWPISSKSLDIR